MRSTTLFALGGLVAFFTIEIAIVSALRYLVESQAAPEPILANGFADPFLVVHVVSGIIALIVSPIQLIPRIRREWPAFHRACGRLYVVAGMVAAPAGLMLALGTTAGPFAAVGFAIPALLWPLFTLAGVHAAIGRSYSEHREWMFRSYAIIANAITLRLMIPTSAFLGIDFFTAYPIIAWLGWMTNLALVEVYLRRSRQRPALEMLATA